MLQNVFLATVKFVAIFISTVDMFFVLEIENARLIENISLLFDRIDLLTYSVLNAKSPFIV